MLLLSFYLINFFFHENYFYFFMFRDVPACSRMFHVPDFIDALKRVLFIVASPDMARNDSKPVSMRAFL